MRINLERFPNSDGFQWQGQMFGFFAQENFAINEDCEAKAGSWATTTLGGVSHYDTVIAPVFVNRHGRYVIVPEDAIITHPSEVARLDLLCRARR